MGFGATIKCLEMRLLASKGAARRSTMRFRKIK